MQVVFDIFIKIFKTRLTAVCALCYKIHAIFDTFPQKARATSPINGEVCGTVKTVPYTHKIHFTG